VTCVLSCAALGRVPVSRHVLCACTDAFLSSVYALALLSNRYIYVCATISLTLFPEKLPKEVWERLMQIVPEQYDHSDPVSDSSLRNAVRHCIYYLSTGAIGATNFQQDLQTAEENAMKMVEAQCELDQLQQVRLRFSKEIHLDTDMFVRACDFHGSCRVTCVSVSLSVSVSVSVNKSVYVSMPVSCFECLCSRARALSLCISRPCSCTCACPSIVNLPDTSHSLIHCRRQWKWSRASTWTGTTTNSRRR
jgi:hypothetical protein